MLALASSYLAKRLTYTYVTEITMAQESTSRKLADMTDAGLFECLATAILRISDDRCCSLNHPGVNANGKTVKSPVDGITFVPGSAPPK